MANPKWTTITSLPRQPIRRRHHVTLPHLLTTFLLPLLLLLRFNSSGLRATTAGKIQQNMQVAKFMRVCGASVSPGKSSSAKRQLNHAAAASTAGRQRSWEPMEGSSSSGGRRWGESLRVPTSTPPGARVVFLPVANTAELLEYTRQSAELQPQPSEGVEVCFETIKSRPSSAASGGPDTSEMIRHTGLGVQRILFNAGAVWTNSCS